MSSFIAVTKHPNSGEWQRARWLDDYFGPHKYAIEFEDGTIIDPKQYRPEISTTEKPTNPDFGWPRIDETSERTIVTNKTVHQNASSAGTDTNVLSKLDAGEAELDTIMEDLALGHNFDYARKAILAWHNKALAQARLEARKETARIYEREIKMLRAFQESVIKREELKLPGPVYLCEDQVCSTLHTKAQLASLKGDKQ